MPVVPLRWVRVRDPAGKFRTQALLSTDLTLNVGSSLRYAQPVLSLSKEGFRMTKRDF
jgi:hypothetical protein